MTEIHIRWLLLCDLPAVLAIEDHAGPGPHWDGDTFRATLHRRNVIGLVAETPGGTVVGYTVFAILTSAYLIRRLAVHPDHRGRGAGRALFAKLAGKLGPRRPWLWAIVRESDTAAATFLRYMGMHARLAPGYFVGEDGYSFRLECPAAVPAHDDRDC